MAATAKNLISPALGDVYPPFKEMMDAYTALIEHGEHDAAARVYLTAQTMAAAFNAGAEYALRGLTK